MFWAGDTAQTIFNGSAFTFNELTASMYRLEVCPRVLQCNKLVAHPMRQKEIFSPFETRHIPQFFSLTVNFRSQRGILRCAQTVLDLIALYWPFSIDKVPKEEGHIGGQRPLYFNAEENDYVLLKSLITKARSVRDRVLNGA